VRPTSFAITAPSVSDVEMFESLTGAVRGSRILNVLYDSLSGEKSTERLVDPYKHRVLVPTFVP
jgi:hypothetical protein